MTYDQWSLLLLLAYGGGIVIWVLGVAFLKGADVIDDRYGEAPFFGVIWPILLPLLLAYWLGTKAAQYRRWRARQK